MLDADGIVRPDDPHAHMVVNKIAPLEREIGENYRFVSKNIFFRLWSRFVRRLGIIFVGQYIKRRYKLKVVGKKNVKLVRRQGCIVTINHVHNLDNLVVGTRLLNHRKCYFITLKENINMPFLGFLLKTMGGIPIPSTIKALKEFDNTISKLLESKKAILICPEVSLWPYFRGIRPFKKGAFSLAVKNNVPILPVVISFRRKQKTHKTKNKSYKYYFTAVVGKSLYSDENLKTLKEKTQDLLSRTHKFYEQTVEECYKNENM